MTQTWIFFLHDVFERLPDEFSSFFNNDGFDVSENFSGGCAFGSVAEVSVIGFGEFEEECFAFVEDLFVALVGSWHDGGLRNGKGEKI